MLAPSASMAGLGGGVPLVQFLARGEMREGDASAVEGLRGSKVEGLRG